MPNQITGILFQKYDAEIKSDKFRKRDFVIYVKEEKNGHTFEDYIKFQLVNDRCGLIDFIPMNERIIVDYNLRGRKYDKDGVTSYFTTVEAFRISSANIITAPVDNVPGINPDELPDNNSEPMPF